MRKTIPLSKFLRVFVLRVPVLRRNPEGQFEPLHLKLDRPTETGLNLRDAMRVRSAEFWLALGEPRLALKELQSLAEVARENAWAARTHFAAKRDATLRLHYKAVTTRERNYAPHVNSLIEKP